MKNFIIELGTASEKTLGSGCCRFEGVNRPLRNPVNGW